jgi:hypothetical protein
LLLLLHRRELLEAILLLLLLLGAATGLTTLFLHALFPFQVRQKLGWNVP